MHYRRRSVRSGTGTARFHCLFYDFAAGTTDDMVLIVTSTLRTSVTTTHTIKTSSMGVDCARRFSALDLRVIERSFRTWIMTIPATAGVTFSFRLVWLSNKVG